MHGEGRKQRMQRTRGGIGAGLGGIRKLKLLIDLRVLGVVEQRAF